MQTLSRNHAERVEHGVPRCRSSAPTETWTATASSCAVRRRSRAPHCAVHVSRKTLHRASSCVNSACTNQSQWITVEAALAVIPCLHLSTPVRALSSPARAPPPCRFEPKNARHAPFATCMRSMSMVCRSFLMTYPLPPTSLGPPSGRFHRLVVTHRPSDVGRC